ncbi:MAG: hypothetical protein ACI4TZ_01285 [Christensenellales bacterium]
MVGYIIIGITILVLLYIAILYFVNSKKIKQNQSKKKEETTKKEEVKEKPASTKPAVVEVKSQVIKGTMFEEAVKEAEKQGYKYEDSYADQSYEKVYGRVDNSRLKLEREEFIPEIKRAEYNRLKPERLVSERQEGPDIMDKSTQKISQEKLKSLGVEINDLSPELKALLVNDVLNRKY